MRRHKGFSLIELLIVVAIILIIAAIAIPNLLRSRIAANEASAVGTLRTINTAEVTYASTYPTKGFSADLAVMKNPSGGGSPTDTAAGLLDDTLATAAPTKSGYSFTYTAGTADSSGVVPSYELTADPLSQNQSGTRHFYTDASAVIRFNTTTTATSSDSPIQ